MLIYKKGGSPENMTEFGPKKELRGRCTSVLPTLRVAILPTFRVAILPTAFLVRLQFFRQLFCTLLKLYIAASKI